MTSGNFQGFDVMLKDAKEGYLVFKSSQINFELPINQITTKDTIFDAGGLGKRVRIFRLPIVNQLSSFSIEKNYELTPTSEKDEIFHVRITLENGHQAWSSPIYFIT